MGIIFDQISLWILFKMRTRDQGYTKDSPDEDALVQVREGKRTAHWSGDLERGKPAFWKARKRVYFSTETDLNNLSIVQRKNLQQEKVFSVCPILSRVVHFSCAILKKSKEYSVKLLAATQHIYSDVYLDI